VKFFIAGIPLSMYFVSAIKESMRGTTKRHFIKRVSFAVLSMSALISLPSWAATALTSTRIRLVAKPDDVRARLGFKKRLQKFQIRTVNDAFRLANSKTEIQLVAE